MARAKTGRRFRVTINRDWRKGCRLCELRCPDLAIGITTEPGSEPGGDNG